MGSFKGIAMAAIAVIALQARAEEPREQGAAGKAQRQMRTMRVEGGYIRYEVLPGDDELPPGQVFLVGAERSPGRKTDGSTAAAQNDAPPAAARPRPAARAQREGEPAGERGRDASCNAERMRLAGRLLELKGINLPDDVALWLKENPHYYPSPARRTLAISLFHDPALATMVQSDFAARGYAEDLARCEGAQASR